MNPCPTRKITVGLKGALASIDKYWPPVAHRCDYKIIHTTWGEGETPISSLGRLSGSRSKGLGIETCTGYWWWGRISPSQPYPKDDEDLGNSH